MTSLSRTIYDVIRTSDAETAIACVDAALRRVAWRGPGGYDSVAAENFRAAVAERIGAAPGERGIRQARFLVELADGRAQLPGESVSRLWTHRLGAPRPILQLPVEVGRRRFAYPDFAWPEQRRFGEFDGDGKYLAPNVTAGRAARDILCAQRTRESEIVAATGWAPVRWGSERLRSPQSFGEFLRSHSLLR